MRAQGFEPEDYDAEEPIEIWPENWPAWVLFCSLGTQWRTAPMGGYVGLDYGPLFTLLDRQFSADPKAWQACFEDVQHLESAALEQIQINHAKK